MPPSVSVIIPTFDRPVLLARAIRSVIMQTLRPLEVIVVDNGRSAVDRDGLPATVRVERTAVAVGSSAARNRGAQLARSDLLAFLDDDDTWSPTYLEKLVDHYVKHPAPVCVGELKRIRRGETSIEPFKLFPEGVAEQRAVFFENPGLTGSNFIVERDYFDRIGGFDPAMRGSQDRDLAARILLDGARIAVCREAVACLHEDASDRSERRHLAGDTRFLLKHWRAMRAGEIALAGKRITQLAYNRLRTVL